MKKEQEAGWFCLFCNRNYENRKKQTIRNEWKHESNKKRKRESTIIHGRPQTFFQWGQRRHFVYHFYIADDQCSLQDKFALSKYMF